VNPADHVLCLLEALLRTRWDGGDREELASGLGAALREWHDVVALELGIEGTAWVRVEVDGASTCSEPREDDLVRTAIASNRAIVRRRPSTGPEISLPIDALARALGSRVIVVLPLVGKHGVGHVAVFLSSARGVRVFESDACRPLLTALARMLDGHVLLHRLAGLSRRAYADNRKLRRDLHERLAEETTSPAMRRALERADAVAPYETSVLVTGPSGAGKEVLARRIHARSAHAGGPFVQLNCGALPESLAETELFGHERGAFTGAVRLHRGVFERAAGGTLLLDEVGDLAPALQVKLLRVLQERTFVRVGGEEPLRTDARVIAATHRPLPELVERGQFREDLYYRLHVFAIEVPALSQRREDIPRVVASLLRDIGQRLGRPVPTVPPDVLDRLVAHPWPGNVRQLASVLEASLIMSPADELRLFDGLDDAIAAEPARSPVAEPETLRAATIRCIAAALQATGGKIYGLGGAAARLGLPPGTLQSKMKRLGISRRIEPGA